MNSRLDHKVQATQSPCPEVWYKDGLRVPKSRVKRCKVTEQVSLLSLQLLGQRNGQRQPLNYSSSGKEELLISKLEGKRAGIETFLSVMI